MFSLQFYTYIFIFIICLLNVYVGLYNYVGIYYVHFLSTPTFELPKKKLRRSIVPRLCRVVPTFLSFATSKDNSLLFISVGVLWKRLHLKNFNWNQEQLNAPRLYLIVACTSRKKCTYRYFPFLKVNVAKNSKQINRG